MAKSKIVVVDYAMGNLRSVQKAFERLGANVQISHNPKVIAKADKLVLPGVGAIEPARIRLEELGGHEAITQFITSERPFLGICLGLQLLFETSEEGVSARGLEILKGHVARFKKGKVPHMGWNTLGVTAKDCPLFSGIDRDAFVYFCHSYFVQPTDVGLAASMTPYNDTFPSSVWRDNMFACQFHPEKSQAVGLKILDNFIKL